MEGGWKEERRRGRRKGVWWGLGTVEGRVGDVGLVDGLRGDEDLLELMLSQHLIIVSVPQLEDDYRKEMNCGRSKTEQEEINEGGYTCTSPRGCP